MTTADWITLGSLNLVLLIANCVLAYWCGRWHERLTRLERDS
jgi:hypothetical protein